MEIFTQSDVFIVLVGTSQIIIVVFLVFTLALIVKILSDVSYITGRIKSEADEIFTDIGKVKKEAKMAAQAILTYLATLAKVSGIKKAVGILGGLSKTKTKVKPEKKQNKKRTTKTSKKN